MKLDKILYEKISNLTGTDYEACYSKNADDDFLFVYDDKVESMLYDLINEIDRLEEKIEDREKDIEDNYKRIDYARQIGED